MHALISRAILVAAALAFITVRKALGFIVRISLPIDHPYRVFQTSVFERFDDEFVRAAFLSQQPAKPTWGRGVRARVALVASFAVNGVMVLALVIPGALL